MNNPIENFMTYWQAAKSASGPANRNSICLSTIDDDGFPNSRFVDLKQVSREGFVFCTHLDSRKACELGQNSKAAISLWWEHISFQCRIRGECTQIPDEEADRYWVTRSRGGQLASIVSQQDRPLESIETLRVAIERADRALGGQTIRRPENWGGFRLTPDKIELFDFSDDRLHVRSLYTLQAGIWRVELLQP